MTRHKTFKHRVRERMAKTGESYTAARRMLIAAGNKPEPLPTTFEPPVAEEKISRATGRGWQEWFETLDAWRATERSHAEIAKWLRSEHGVDNWYSQSITVGYERARGMRAAGQRTDGFTTSASKTIAVPVQRLYEAFTDDAARQRWLPGADLRIRTSTPSRSVRFDWEDGETRVNVGFADVGEGKSRVALSHARLLDADSATEMKTW